MKTKILIFLSIAFTNCFLYSQDSTVIKNDYEKDTISKRKFDYVKPKNGIKPINPEYGVEREPTFRKCRNIEDSNDRRDCFSRIFYGRLKRKVKHDDSLLGKQAVEMLVQFTITKTGELKDIKFLKSNDPTGKYEKKIIEFINELPPMEPGLKNGKPVNIPFSFPIKFS